MANSEENRSVQHLRRLLPRTQREFRRHFLNDWRYALKKAQDRPKYHVSDPDLRVFVISLERVSERKLETIRALETQRIQWATHRAVDGLDDLDMVLVTKYAGYKKQKLLGVTTGIRRADLMSLKRDYDNSKHVPTHLRISLHERLRFGCYMSHVLLWQKLLRRDVPYAVVLEDDAVITDNFSNELKARVQKLPDNWDILFLNGCYKKFGYVFDDGLRQSRGGLCTFAYTISLKGARYLLQRAVVRSDKPIDHVLDYETLMGRLVSFHAYPPLAYTSSHMLSTLAY
jgi:GR25 family glycosyltransferase involved in LPS biosynthesis